MHQLDLSLEINNELKSVSSIVLHGIQIQDQSTESSKLSHSHENLVTLLKTFLTLNDENEHGLHSFFFRRIDFKGYCGSESSGINGSFKIS